MKTALSLLLLMTALAGAETNGFWKTDFASAIKGAKENGRPVLVQFHAPWCGPCRVMKQTTLQEKPIVEALGNFVRVSLDFDENPDLAKQYGVQAIPAFVVVDPEGETIAKTVGFMDATHFQDWLMNGVAAAAYADGQRKVFQEKRAQIIEKLKATDPQQKGWAIDTLLDLSSNTEKSYQSFALEKLKVLAEENPHQLVDALNHPRLATRIHIANLLQNKLSSIGQYDPWESPDARAKMVEILRAEKASKN